MSDDAASDSGAAGSLAGQAADLFRAYLAGDDSAMRRMVELLTPILWHTARAQRLDTASAEDVVQSTWLALVRHTTSISDPQAVLQWLIVSTRRESWRLMRKIERARPTTFEADSLVAPAGEMPESAVLREAGAALLWQHVGRLSQRCRQLLRVIAFASRPDYAGVASALGMPVGSIGPTRGRCLAKLRLQLAEDPQWDRA